MWIPVLQRPVLVGLHARCIDAPGRHSVYLRVILTMAVALAIKCVDLKKYSVSEHLAHLKSVVNQEVCGCVHV